MFRYFIILFMLIITSGNGNQYFKDNQILIYIKNDIPNFNILKNQLTTTDRELNDLLINENAKWIKKWIPQAKPVDRDNNIFLSRYYLVEFKERRNSIENVLYKFQRLSSIRVTEKVPIIKIDFTPNDEYWEEQYALRQIGADLAFDLWNIEDGESPGYIEDDEISVAIVDLGFDWDHPDLINNIWRNLGEDIDGDGDVLNYVDGEWIFDPDDINGIDDDADGYVDNFIGYDVYSDDNEPNTSEQHGTMVAGCVSAQTNNQEGIASVGWSVKLIGINSGQGGYLTSGFEGIMAAAHMDADIINCSWGGTSYIESNEVVINIAYNQYNCSIVAAAGNSGLNEPHYPASYENVISVTATGPGSNFNCWPNFHETVDIAAPGEDIFTTANNSSEYESVTGTSFSSPIVAGGIALIKSIFPYADNTMLKSKIILSADYFNDMDGECGGENLDGLLGAGELNIEQAIHTNIAPNFTIANVALGSSNGLQLPGDTTSLIITIENQSGAAPVENIFATLSSDDSLLIIINNEYSHNAIVGSGNDFNCEFLISSSENISLGYLPLDLTVNANVSGNLPSNLTFDEYSYQTEIHVPFGFNQEGYPIDSLNIYGVPIFTDLYGNSLNQIYFGSDSLLFGKWISGLDVVGFPFNANSQITTTTAAGDLDGDGDKELVFGTSDGTIYALSKDGTEFLSYSQSKEIIEYPVLYDIDNNGTIEIIFISVNDTTSDLFVLSHDGMIFDGFPLTLTEIVNTGAAAADINSNGNGEIVIATIDGKVYVIDKFGAILDGFPFNINSAPSGAPTLANIDNEIGLETIIGSETDGIYIISYSAGIVDHFNVNDNLESGVSIGDLNNDGTLELIYITSDQLAHAYDPLVESEIEGWPYQFEDNIFTEPIVCDFDGDNYFELVTASIGGNIFIINHDGSDYDNFPYISQDSIFVTPSLGDLDLDNDYEIIFSTKEKLQILDLQSLVGDGYSWKSYRSNNYRNGFYDTDLADLELINESIPEDYSLDNNYPNPFNPLTKIVYNLPKKSNVKINIYDIKGRRVIQLVDMNQSAGKKSIAWNGKNIFGEKVACGVYICEMRIGDFSQSRKMVLLK